jgi:membrane-bound metal-dependent hydrolase YbcI (DUF457 family)
MEKLELVTLIAGGVLPLLISLLKRWIKLGKQQVSLLVLVVCFIIAAVIELASVDFNWEVFVGRLAVVYTTSQAVYLIIMKTIDLDTRIEGE